MAKKTGFDPSVVKKALEEKEAKKIGGLRETNEGIDIKRLKTGIPGFDEIVGGGLPDSSVIMISGGAGTGKTTFSIQYLYEGAKIGESGVYISLEEDPKRIIRDMALFGWDLEKYIKEKKLLIIRPEMYKWENLLKTVENSIRQINAKRVVIDSITLIELFFKDKYEIRKKILALNRLLKGLNCTTLLITEIEEQSHQLSTSGIEEYIADGVIVLYYTRKGSVFSRAVTIRKMRSTSHRSKIHPLQINTPGGILIFPSEEVFEEIP